MLRFYAAAFVQATLDLEWAAEMVTAATSDKQRDAAREQVWKVANALAQEATKLPLAESVLEQLADLSRRAQDRRYDDFLLLMIHDTKRGINAALGGWLFLAIPASHRQCYEDPRSFWGGAIFDAFPDSERDLLAAARCFALDEWTACVFHAMRGVEKALRGWARELGVVMKVQVDDANQQEILDAADKAIKALEQSPRTEPGRAAKLKYFSESAIQFRAFKNAWRNHVSHGRETYDERVAEEILRHVKSFMENLAAVPEN